MTELSPAWGKAATVFGLVAYCVIRAPHGQLSRKTRVAEDRKGALEVLLLLGAVAGTAIVPLAWVFGAFRAWDFPLRPAPFAAGVAVMAVGLWLFRRSHTDLGRNWSVTLQLREEHKLVTNGVYARMRHPMYSAMFLLGVGQVFYLPNKIAAPAYFVGFGLLYALRVRAEERMMRDRFGAAYDEYAARVPRLLPFGR